MKYTFLPLGMVFGFLLSRVGATNNEYYAQLFLFEDLRLLVVMATAAAVGVAGVAILKWLRAKALVGGQALSFAGKPFKPGLVGGSLLFGVGWGLAGACPGTALAMMGEGKLGALFTVAGLLLGTYAYGVLQSFGVRQRQRGSQERQPAGVSA
jgi:uncharacterized membrane protein YedE/YeeE